MPSFRFAAIAAMASSLVFIAVNVASAAAPAATVSIDNFMFTPMTVAVPAGATVIWVNHDDVPHTVRAVDGSFHSQALDTDERYSFTFAKPGVYSYYCSVHPKMVAKVIVK
jgi:plastocyanin